MKKIEGIAKLASRAKFSDFFAGSIFCKVTYPIGHRRFAKNRIQRKNRKFGAERSFATPSILLFFGFAASALSAYDPSMYEMPDVKEVLGIESIEQVYHPEEIRLETCVEGGNSTVTVRQTLQVALAEEERDVKEIHRCQGHTEISHPEGVYWYHPMISKQREAEWKESLEKTPGIVKVAMKRDSKCIRRCGIYCMESQERVVATYWHADDHETCNHFLVLKTESNTDRPGVLGWVSDAPWQLAALEARPECRLVKIHVLAGPETRVIGDVPVERDAWERELVFSCADEGKGKPCCAELRKKGGMFVRQECLEESEDGECVLWKKTYDFGKKAAYTEEIYHFEDGKTIFGLNGEFDPGYEKSSDFPEVANMLILLGEIGGENPSKGFYAGKPCRCRCRYDDASPVDCCKETSDSRCSSQEQELAQMLREGKCHFVGSRSLDTGTERVYVCFASKHVRILQEQGREKLGLHWGTMEEPDCRGLTPEQIEKIRLSTIDFSETEGDFPTPAPPEKFAERMHNYISEHLEKRAT